MAKIKFDYTPINNNCIESINRAINDLNGLSNKIDSVSIPGDFEYYSFVRKMSGDLAIRRQNLDNFKSWLKNTNNSYDKNLNDYKLGVDSIQNIKFSK